MPTLSKKKKMQKNLTFNETERKEIYNYKMEKAPIVVSNGSSTV